MAYADTPKGAGINSGYAFDVAKLQKNTETTKDKEQKRALETVVPGDGSPFKATAVSSVDGAKVSLRSSASQPVRQEIANKTLICCKDTTKF